MPPVPTDLVELSVWAADVTGLYAAEVKKRRAVLDCIDKLKAKGVIR